LACALAVPVLPLGNIALALALLYALVAAAVFVVSIREPESGLVAAVGPLLAVVSGLALLPLAALGIRSPVRRALQVALAVVAAGIVAGVRGSPMPLDGRAAPHGLGLAGSRSVSDTASVLWRALLDHPSLAVAAVVLALAAAVLPLARARGLWATAGLSASMLAALLLPVPDVAAIPIVVSVWATFLATSVH
jgi:hypothetical protein